MTASPDAFEPASRTFLSQGLELRYFDWGNEGAPVLILVHGVRDHARSWDWTARALRNDWHVLALDLRGHGDSQWSPDAAYFSAYHVVDFANFVATLGDAPLTIVGHSFGGGIVARFTGAYPDRVRRLALVEGLGPSAAVLAEWAREGLVKRTRDWIEARRATAAKPPRRMASLAEATERMKAANPHLSADQARHLAEHGARQHADGYGWKYDPLVGVFGPEDFTTESAASWKEISCPTLLFYGTESWTHNPEADGRAAHFRDHRTLVFEGAGHWLHHDQFDRFVAELKAFL